MPNAAQVDVGILPYTSQIFISAYDSSGNGGLGSIYPDLQEVYWFDPREHRITADNEDEPVTKDWTPEEGREEWISARGQELVALAAKAQQRCGTAPRP